MIKNKDLFFKIVQIDSISGKEEKMVEFVNHFLTTECGFETTIDENMNIFLQLPGEGEPVFFNCHLDTVEPGSNIKSRMDGDIFYSSGKTILGADNKASVSALLVALIQISRNKNHNWRPLDILFTTSEEVGCYGALSFDKSRIRAKKGYIFDGTGKVGTIMSGSPFYARFDINIIGKSAHAGFPQDSVPAIPDFISVLKSLESINIQQVLLNTGVVRGGDVRNSIIGEFNMEGEIRSFDEKSFYLALAEVEKICLRKYNCKIKHDVVVENKGYIHSDQEINEVREEMKNILGYDVDDCQTFGVSDANIFNDNKNGLRVFNLGDGVEGAHTTEEFVSLSSIDLMTRAYLELAKNN